MTIAAFLDGNWVLHKTFHVQKQASDQAISRAVLDAACKYVMRVQATEAAFCMDGGNNFRYKVDPNYKSNRGGHGPSGDATDPNDMYSLIEPVRRLFTLVGFPFYQRDIYEADDLCAAGSASHTDTEGNEAVIICRDKDSFQYASKKVKIFWPAVGEEPEMMFGPKEVEKRTGLTPRKFAEYQILAGDSIDKIPGILKPAKAKQVLREHGSLKSYFATEEGRKFFLANETRLRCNLLLVRMDMKSWEPECMSTKLTLQDSQRTWKEYGKLPDSFYQLKSFLSGSKRKSLF